MLCFGDANKKIATREERERTCCLMDTIMLKVIIYTHKIIAMHCIGTRIGSECTNI